ncbi:UDP-N-acetylmuramoyl-tripeptide--D-alanyl-D-alanine ligase [soil metagenome]
MMRETAAVNRSRTPTGVSEPGNEEELRSFWRLGHMAAAIDAARPDEARDVFVNVVSTDTRTLAPGALFIALKGETFDGHDHLAAAALAGAAAVLVEREPDGGTLAMLEAANCAVLRVVDTRRALGALAAAYRRTLTRTRVIAVCGSNGKTTTVRMLESVLGQCLRGTASVKSFNNDVGVPLTILRARPDDEFLICEVGTNAPREIATLGAIVRPDIAVITSIGREHLQGLGSLEGVAAEEAAILAAVRPGGLAIVTADSPELERVIERLAATGGLADTALSRFGFAEGADLRVTAHAPDPGAGGIRFTLQGREPGDAPLLLTVPLAGAHNASNAAAAVLAAWALNLSNDHIARGLAAVSGADMRWQRTQVRGLTVINDAYNANPDSMIAGLRTFADLTLTGRRVLILGEMFELGAASEEGHRAVGREVALLFAPSRPPHASHAESEHIHLITIGPMARWIAAEAGRALPANALLSFESLDAPTLTAITALLKSVDTVLLKGSRRAGLERILGALQSQCEP